MLTCAVWGSQWHYLAVTIHCDNSTAVAAINSGYGQVTQLMHLLRCLFLLEHTFSLQFMLCTLGQLNSTEDAISCNKLSSFLSLVSAASYFQEMIPLDLLNLQTKQQTDWTSQTWTRLFSNCFWPV